MAATSLDLTDCQMNLVQVLGLQNVFIIKIALKTWFLFSCYPFYKIQYPHIFLCPKFNYLLDMIRPIAISALVQVVNISGSDLGLGFFDGGLY